jgi:hypothetical protein
MAFTDNILGAVSRAKIGPMPFQKGVSSALGSGNDDLGVAESNTPIVLDASIQEGHMIQGDVTDHPVETGADVVDHYRVKPRTITIDGIITNTPIETGFVGSTAVASVTAIANGDADPVTNAWEELQRFFDQAVVLKIETSLKVYENMVLTSLSVNRTASTGNELRFNASARAIRFVQTEEAEAIQIPKTTTGQKQKPKGKKTTKEANPEQVKSASVTTQTLDAIGSFFS